MAERGVAIPELSAGTEEVLLLRWLVAPGDAVTVGQPLAEVSTDKVDTEFESPVAGTVVRLLVAEGDRVGTGSDVLVLDAVAEAPAPAPALAAAPAAPPAAAPIPAPSPAPAPAPTPMPVAAPAAPAPAVAGARVAASPLVRRRARKLGVDLTGVAASGPRGQVTQADLERHVAAGPAAPAAAPRAPAASGRSDAARRRAVRLATARTTIRSAAIPQFTLYRRIDVGAASERRAGRSWVTEIGRALAAALWRHPECNAVWDDEAGEPRPLPGVRIGIAVDGPVGLVVVAVDDPDALAPEAADATVRAAIARGRAGEVRPEDLRDVSTSISSLGGLGVDRFNALLVPPQPTILSVGRIADTPVVVDGVVRVRPMMEVGLTVDHRVADGADGARFLETFLRRFEGLDG